MVLITRARPLASRAYRNVWDALRAMTELTHANGSHGCPRYSSNEFKTQKYEAVVVGSGPAGIAVVGNLLELKKSPVLWVDDQLQAGRLNRYYRKVPSNTKVKLFIAYADALSPFQEVIKKTPSPNAYTALQNLDQNGTCHIAEAADLCLMLTKGLDHLMGVQKQLGRVFNASWSESENWKIKIEHPGMAHSEPSIVTSKLLILCTGAHPSSSSLPVSNLQNIGLDPALNPEILSTILQRDAKTSVAVIGASHSAILVLRNLYYLATSSHPDLRIKWFTRHPLRYAEERDGWVLRDNTGLKGVVAAWARNHLEEERLPLSHVSRHIEKVTTTRTRENDDYRKYLPSCTHVVQAIGFQASEIPVLERDGMTLNVAYDHHTGAFVDRDGRNMKGLYGAGIAWPEKVTDPEGNIEYAVGMWKFMKYLKRVMPGWKVN